MDDDAQLFAGPQPVYDWHELLNEPQTSVIRSALERYVRFMEEPWQQSNEHIRLGRLGVALEMLEDLK